MKSAVKRMSAEEAEAKAQTPLGPISAVVVNYQGEAYLEACLESLRSQSLEIAEIIVVDNASTDKSVKIIHSKFRGVQTLKMKDNVGPCTARNVGMRAAKYRWVLVLDNDVVLEDNVVQRLVDAATSRDDVAMVQPRSVYKDEPTRIHYDGGDLHYAGLISLRNFGVERSAASNEPFEEIDVAISLCVLIDKKYAIEAGAFDESFFILFEDLDLSHRLRMMGKVILKVNDAIALHDSGTPGISYRDDAGYPGQRVFFHSRNRWLYMSKTMGLWTFIVASPGIFIYEVAWLLFAAKEGHLGPWFRGKRAWLRMAGEARRKRRSVQRRRKVPDRRLYVGGPLTLSPNMAASRGTAARLLDFSLRTWWSVCRWLVR